MKSGEKSGGEAMDKIEGRVLIVDDEKNIRRTLSIILRGIGLDTAEAEDGGGALDMLQREVFDLMLLDIKMPGLNGIDVLKAVKEKYPAQEVIIISGHGSIQDAVEATRLGAYSFIEKPIERETLLVNIRNCFEKINLEKENLSYRQKFEEEQEIIGESSVMKELLQSIEKVAPTKGRVLISGESGTGKELVARRIHKLGAAPDAPFVKVNCAAIPHDLIESELFGHEKGSFTGAVLKRTGKFEQAHKGTLFMDEIGDMSLSAQAKVLRTLQTGEIVKIGGDKPIHVSVRVIAATNKDLIEEIKNDRFREDLYFRINVVPIKTPPLRSHKEDIPLLAERFLERFCRENGFKRKELDEKVIENFMAYHWPGNVRELKNLIERLVIMGGNPISVDDLPPQMKGESKDFLPKDMEGLSLDEAKRMLEKRLIQEKLEEHNWNISKAARSLGVERTNLHKKIKAYDLKRSN